MDFRAELYRLVEAYKSTSGKIFMKRVCPHCKGIGSVNTKDYSQPRNTAGEIPGRTESCPACKGQGFLKTDYFLEKKDLE